MMETLSQVCRKLGNHCYKALCYVQVGLNVYNMWTVILQHML